MIPKHLEEKINLIPSKPGVYQMKDQMGNVIYIGKSKKLKTRVKSYFNKQQEWSKIKRMVFHIKDIDFIETDTHLEAQILECALIKKMKPIYNSQFKNHQKYTYLVVEEDYKYNSLLSISTEDKGSYVFGPYRNKNILREINNFFTKAYPISKGMAGYDFTYKVLPEPLRKEEFIINQECLIEIFTVREALLAFIFLLEEKMKLAATHYQFELASYYRDLQYYVKYLFDHNMQRSKSSTPRRILMGEEISNGFKLFYIFRERIILKKRYKNISKEEVNSFIEEGKKMEKKEPQQHKDEKSLLDFKQIVNIEIQDETSKAVISIQKSYDLDLFISKLKRK